MTEPVTEFSWRDPAAPLLAIGARLGIDPRWWVRAEELEMLSTPTDSYSLGRFRTARAEIVALVSVYGDALDSLALRLSEETIATGEYPGADNELDLLGAAGAPGEDLLQHVNRFLGQFADEAQDLLVLDLTLDKTRLVARTLDLPAGVRASCFLFPEAFRERFTRLHFLGGGASVEGRARVEQWWDEERPEKLVVLLPGWRAGEPPEGRVLSGPLLALVGGDPRDLWQRATAGPTPVLDGPAAYRMRRDVLHLHWEEPWFRNLTPVHLRLAGGVPADDPLATPLRWQLANLVVLYTADSVWRDAGGWIATYEGVAGRVRVRLPDPPAALRTREAEGIGVWAELFEWVYCGGQPSPSPSAPPAFAHDRLAVLQNVICRDARGLEPEEVFERLLARMPDVKERVRLGWKAFIEGKVDAFFTQAQALEEHVAVTVRGFVEQTSSLLKRLSETMLAAVAVIVAALVLPAIREGSTDFRVLFSGLMVYTVYVFAFPLIYGMTQNWQEHRDLERQFEERYRRFKRYLPGHWVEQVGREAVDRSLARYRTWFWLTLATYVALLEVLTLTLLAIGGWLLMR